MKWQEKPGWWADFGNGASLGFFSIRPAGRIVGLKPDPQSSVAC